MVFALPAGVGVGLEVVVSVAPDVHTHMRRR
jgi:hypothetical protein